MLIDTKTKVESIKKEEMALKFLNGQVEDLTARFYELEYLSNKNRPFTQKLISKFPQLYILFNRKNNGLKNTYINLKGFNAIKNNHLIDIGYYLKNNKDIRVSGVDPILHYIYHGYQEGRNPNPQFNSKYYTEKYSDVKKSKLNPLIHYSLYGKKEGRQRNIMDTSIEPLIMISESEANAKYEEILKENISLLDLHHFDENAPLVSIIILNRNGLNHLKRLFKYFKEDIQYPNYEIIVVDNLSSDKSLSFLEELKNSLPLTIIKNSENKSFSRANNEAVQVAKGEYILLLNNDIEPTYGWLNQMMQTALNHDKVGTVGAKLVYPNCSESIFNKNNSFKIQHTGIVFQNLNTFFRPINRGKGYEVFNSTFKSEKCVAGNTAATLLVKKDLYLKVGGLDERYYYGYEDVDFCLKLLKRGYKNIYCPKALLFHYEYGSDEKISISNYRDIKFQNNKKLLMSKWFDWLSNKFFLDKLNSECIFSEKPFKVAFAVTECGENASAGDYFTALEFSEALKDLKWDVMFLSRNGPGNWYEVPNDVDVLISLLDAYDPRKIICSNLSLIKIAWPRNWFDRWAEHSGLYEYDIIFASSQIACNYIKEKTDRDAILLPIATNASRFNNNVQPMEEYYSDYCFTGSYWYYPRDVIKMLNPKSIDYTFRLYGKNWEKVEKLQEYYQGFIEYFQLPELYASTKLVIDDANIATKNYGSVNSRVFDALASGALVITNGEIGAQETFGGLLPSYHSKKELHNLIEYYLSNDEVRLTKIKELQQMILEDHTYNHRAQTLKKALEEYINIKNGNSE
ncbi:glycosyltransferase family protein [Methanobacterium aggregans]|uniref:glycosyltransferase family protein n=1 Tax=Methanobacterium aggregans TaxID=1615586 RepID=UPI001AE75534|nr:glycosyltransferase [Methanobacterium aggregans]MBP2046660.1 GT2 family glycosyltransferase [Methanobacterium aggregans]